MCRLAVRLEADHTPQLRVRRLRRHASRGEHADFVALAHLPARKLDRFRNVPLEVQAEGTSIGQCRDLPLEVLGKLGFLRAELP